MRNELCDDCRFAEWDYNESGSWIEDCRKGLRPEWDEEQESLDCEGFREVMTDERSD